MYKFTIIIPTYNNASYLQDAINSIVDQNFNLSEIQILIVDDGSIDNTKALIEKIKKQQNLKLEYVYKKNGNWGSVINFVKTNKLAKGKYITILDVDDVYTKNALYQINKVIDQEYDLIIGNFFKKGILTKFHVQVYGNFLKIPKDKIQAQTPFCIPLGKFLSNSLFYQLPDLKENISYQDAIFTANAINLATTIYHVNKALGIYNYKRLDNSMSQPWDNKRYQIEIEICLNLLKLDAQEIVAIHIMRNKFRKLLKESMFSFTVHRKFKFTALPLTYRWIVWIIYKIMLTKYFHTKN